MGAAAAVLVHVLGDVGEVREIAERAHDVERLRDRQRIEQRGQFVRTAGASSSTARRKRTAVCRIASMRSKLDSPVCARSTSPSTRPSRRVSSLSGRSLSPECCWAPTLASLSAPRGGAWSPLGRPGGRSSWAPTLALCGSARRPLSAVISSSTCRRRRSAFASPWRTRRSRACLGIRAPWRRPR